MSGTDRRTVLRLAMLAALAPTMLPQPARAAMPGLIAPPAGPMRYRRTLERQLAGGAAIVVAREFRITFRQIPSGFLVEGRQIGVEARFPPGLEQFAALEEAQEETGLFPLRLDPFGQIVSTAEANAATPAIGEAVKDAVDRIRLQPIAQGERQELLGFVESLHRAGSAIIAQLPGDLFAPVRGDRSEQQEITLPTGEEGRVLSRFVAARDITTGLMREALREVRTEIGEDRRQTREDWSLARV